MQESPKSSPPRRRNRQQRWWILLAVAVVAAVTATAQQGLLQDGFGALRRYGDSPAHPAETSESTAAVRAFDFGNMPSFRVSSDPVDLDVEFLVSERRVGASFREEFDPRTTPTLSDIDLERLAAAAATIDTDATCPETDTPESLSDHAEILRIADGCILVEYEPLKGRTLQKIRDDLSRDSTVYAVGLPPQDIVLDQLSYEYSDDPNAADQWHLPKMQAQELWRGWPNDATVTVAVIDDGVHGGHPDLERNLIASGHECHRKPAGSHGTHVAGIIAAEQGNGLYVAGIAPEARILPLSRHDCERNWFARLFRGPGNVTVAVKTAVNDNEGVDVINMSLSWPSSQNVASEAALRAAMLNNIVVVTSAGNCGGPKWKTEEECRSQDQRMGPAIYPGVIAVASTTKNDTHADYSTANVDVDISAPGNFIWSTYFVDDGTEEDDFVVEHLEGTSMAAPIISGVVAHLKARFPLATVGEIQSALYRTSKNLEKEENKEKNKEENPERQWTAEQGNGLVQPLEAIRWLERHFGAGIDYEQLDEAKGETPLLLVVDTSGSMGDSIEGELKLDLAKRSILKFLAGTSPTRQVALRSYPAKGGSECHSGELQIDFSTQTSEVENIVRHLQADGNTPTAEALQAALEDIRDEGYTQAEIALFSDGESKCADPCLAAEEIAASGVEIRVHVGAFVASGQGRAELKCIADKTHGTYMEIIDDSAFAEGLSEFLERNSKPRLQVALILPDQVAPSTDPATPVKYVRAVVRNDSNVAARDVVVSFEPAGASKPTRRVVAIGNVAAGEESSVIWELRPGFASVGADLALKASVTTANAPEVVTAVGSVAVSDPNVASDAGPILGVGQIVVMGDQLLSGAGSSTGGLNGGCESGRMNGLLEAFGQRPERSFACPNAAISQLVTPDSVKEVDSQIDRLAELLADQQPVDGVILSIGATDFGLSTLARECVLSVFSCDTEISGVATETWLARTIAGEGSRREMALAELVRALGAIDRELNSTGGESQQTPILLLAQPRAFPFVSGSCFARWQGDDPPLLTQRELDLYHHFVSAVNGTLEAAASGAQDLGLPVFYVHTTETAYQPDHTACSTEPYVRSLEPLLDVKPAAIIEIAESGVLGLVDNETRTDELAEFSETFLAPNAYGEQALANALLRWSRTDEASEAHEFLNDAFVRRSAGVAAPLIDAPTTGETRLIGQGELVTSEPGHGWTAVATGFLPGTLVTAVVRPSGRVVSSAVADDTGAAKLYVVVTVGEAESSETAIIASGRGRSGEIVTVVQPVEILRPQRPVLSLILPALAALLLLSALVLRRAARRHDD